MGVAGPQPPPLEDLVLVDSWVSHHGFDMAPTLTLLGTDRLRLGASRIRLL